MLSNYPKTLSSPGFYGGYTPFSDSYLAEALRGMLEVVKFAGNGYDRRVVSRSRTYVGSWT